MVNPSTNSLSIETLRNNYFKWLKEALVFKEINGAIEITAPLLDRHNDHLQIFALPQKDGIKLTDDGYIIEDLIMSGCDIDSSPRRKEVLNSILNGLGVQRGDNNEIFVITDQKNYPIKKHMLLQAMLSINDMFYLSRGTVQTLFWEDVYNFLFDNDFSPIENISFVGKSGYNQKFDFVLPGKKNTGEKVIQAINCPTKQSIENLIFKWDDVKSTRRPGSSLYAFLNDRETKGIDNVIHACNEYNVTPLLWTNKQEARELLSA